MSNFVDGKNVPFIVPISYGKFCVLRNWNRTPEIEMVYPNRPLGILSAILLIFAGHAYAQDKNSNPAETYESSPKTFLVDIESASVDTRERLGVNLDAEGLLNARAAAADALPSDERRVKNSRLLTVDPIAFSSKFFDGPVRIDLPNGEFCIAEPIKIQEESGEIRLWLGTCESEIDSANYITLSISPSNKSINGTIYLRGRKYEIRPTSNDQFHVVVEIDRDFVPEKQTEL